MSGVRFHVLAQSFKTILEKLKIKKFGEIQKFHQFLERLRRAITFVAVYLTTQLTNYRPWWPSSGLESLFLGF